MKVKELIEIIHPEVFVYLEDPSDIFQRKSPPKVSVPYILEYYGNREVEEITSEHDWDSSDLYIILRRKNRC